MDAYAANQDANASGAGGQFTAEQLQAMMGAGAGGAPQQPSDPVAQLQILLAQQQGGGGQPQQAPAGGAGGGDALRLAQLQQAQQLQANGGGAGQPNPGQNHQQALMMQALGAGGDVGDQG